MKRKGCNLSRYEIVYRRWAKDRERLRSPMPKKKKNQQQNYRWTSKTFQVKLQYFRCTYLHLVYSSLIHLSSLKKSPINIRNKSPPIKNNQSYIFKASSAPLFFPPGFQPPISGLSVAVSRSYEKFIWIYNITWQAIHQKT